MLKLTSGSFSFLQYFLQSTYSVALSYRSTTKLLILARAHSHQGAGAREKQSNLWSLCQRVCRSTKKAGNKKPQKLQTGCWVFRLNLMPTRRLMIVEELGKGVVGPTVEGQRVQAGKAAAAGHGSEGGAGAGGGLWMVDSNQNKQSSLNDKQSPLPQVMCGFSSFCFLFFCFFLFFF